jgi:cystathionine beta-lyase/cystathionine gamma-synthase
VNSAIYGVTYEFFDVDVRRLGVQVILEDVFDVNLLEKILKEVSGHEYIGVNASSQHNVMVFLESITNPLVKVANISCIAAVCKKYGAMLVVDNTMATPLRMKPLLEVRCVLVMIFLLNELYNIIIICKDPTK